MITNTGRLNLKRFFAGEIGAWAGALALGVGPTAPTLADVNMSYEVVRVPITAIASDAATNRVILKATVPPGSLQRIYEIGVFTAQGTESGRVLNLVDPGLSQWVSGVLTPSNGRANAQTVRLDFTASGTTTAELSGVFEDLSSYQDSDEFVLGFYNTANVSVVRLRFGTDASNYFEISVATPAAGYNIRRIERSAATVVGTPSWDAITYFAIRVTGTAGGSGSVYFDGVRIENDTSSEVTLVSRTVPVTPIELDQDIASEVEYSMEINFT